MGNRKFSDLSEEERDALLSRISNSFTSEEIETLRDLSSWWNDPESIDARQTFLSGMREFLTALNKEIAKDPDTSSMTLDEALESGKFAELCGRVADKLGGEVERSLFSNRFLPMLTGQASTDIVRTSARRISDENRDIYSGNAVLTTPAGNKVTIENYTDLMGSLSTSANKIFLTSLCALTDANYYRSKDVTPTVEFPLVEYGEMCGLKLTPDPAKIGTDEEEAEKKRVKERIKEFRKSVRADLHDLSSILWTAEVHKGPNKGDYREMRIMSSHSISRGMVRINFDMDAARYFNQAYITQFPTSLLKLDNRNPNALAIGYAIAIHNSMDNNSASGTDCTLSVKKLLESAPDIPTIEDLERWGQRNWKDIPTIEDLERWGQRNWKDKIKRKLDEALNELVRVEYLSRWEYRDSKTGRTYTLDEASSFSWSAYSSLMVDYVVADPPDQTERRALRSAKKEKAALASGATKKKRGRPRKTKEGGK